MIEFKDVETSWLWKTSHTLRKIPIVLSGIYADFIVFKGSDEYPKQGMFFLVNDLPQGKIINLALPFPISLDDENKLKCAFFYVIQNYLREKQSVPLTIVANAEFDYLNNWDIEFPNFGSYLLFCRNKNASGFCAVSKIEEGAPAFNDNPDEIPMLNHREGRYMFEANTIHQVSTLCFYRDYDAVSYAISFMNSNLEG